MMEQAKVTSKGQITIPINIRKSLGVKEGDKILFIQNGNEILIRNASVDALLVAQKNFEGVAEELGVSTLEDVVDMIKEVRKESGGKYR